MFGVGVPSLVAHSPTKIFGPFRSVLSYCFTNVEHALLALVVMVVDHIRTHARYGHRSNHLAESGYCVLIALKN